ncbi:hypothetical protein Bca52824_052114 [Brassica carinata]|uniref:Uncharacterized protein n=1 Tax=Brassica carinata TaxID=52824 RepID=A0A8X7R1S1_BRACI|nr:hypothetical protein Bca52824_052114 [Brassica carinata]
MAPIPTRKNAVHFINRISAMVAHTFAFDFHLGVVPKAESLDADPAYMEMPHPKVACSQARLNHLLGHAQFIKKYI